MIPKTTRRMENIEDVIRKAFCVPSFFNFSVNTGIYAAESAPSAKRSRRRFGIRKAATKASMPPAAPNTAAKDASRKRPKIRDTTVASENRPVFLRKDFFSVDK
jgi:hypothetical protein